MIKNDEEFYMFLLGPYKMGLITIEEIINIFHKSDDLYNSIIKNAQSKVSSYISNIELLTNLLGFDIIRKNTKDKHIVINEILKNLRKLEEI